MGESLKVDKGYRESFNLGYELAKELKLKSPMFQDLNLDNVRMNAMQLGMAEYSKETAQGKNKEISRSFNLENKREDIGKNKDKGLDFSI